MPQERLAHGERLDILARQRTRELAQALDTGQHRPAAVDLDPAARELPRERHVRVSPAACGAEADHEDPSRQGGRHRGRTIGQLTGVSRACRSYHEACG